MASQRVRHRMVGRSALVWVLVLFVSTQAVLGLWLYGRHPEMVDPDYLTRLAHLEARLAAAPGRPLVLVLGSSRAAMGIRPASLGDVGSAGRPAPLVFNFAGLGCGPVREWLTLRRLMARGVRPQWVLVEVCALFWPQTGFYCEEGGLMQPEVYAADLPVLDSLYDRGWPALTRLLTEVATPIIPHRHCIGKRYARCLMPPGGWGSAPGIGWQDLDPDGWLPPLPRQTPWDEYVARQRPLAQPILDDFHVDVHTDQALRGLLGDCRAGGMKTALFVAPESSPLRSWYPPTARATFADHVTRLAAEYGVPVFDTRDWIADEGFSDYCHLSQTGAEAFSARLGREVVRPLLQGHVPPPYLPPVGGP
jgi:hypothetical protein